VSKLTWPEGAASVIILPSGSDGERLLNLASEWTSSWLLGTAFWVQTEDIPLVKGNNPPDVKAWVLGRNEDGSPARSKVDLFWALGAQKFNLIRLIAARTEQTAEAQAATSVAIAAAAEYLDAAKPEQIDQAVDSPEGTKLVKVNLVFAATESNRVQKSVLEPSWNANIIAAAEDRPTPLSFDSFVVSESSRYDGFVLAHIATAAGLWAGLHQSTVEMGGLHPVTGNARLQRVFVRAVASDTLSGDLAKWAIERAASDDNETSLGRVASEEVSAIDPEIEGRKISEVVSFLLDGPAVVGGGNAENFRYMPYDPNTWGKDVKGGLTKGISNRLRDVAEAFAYIPRWTSEWIADRMDGSENDQEESKQQRKHLPKRLDPVFLIERPEVVVANQNLKVPRATPDLWRHVRETIAASIDSPSAEVIAPLRSDNSLRLFFGDLGHVLPDSSVTWSPEEFLGKTSAQMDNIGWLDTEATQKQRTALLNTLDELSPGMDDARMQMQETQTAFDLSVRVSENAEFELDRAREELSLDEDFAEEMREDHTHQLPESLVGPHRPSIYSEPGSEDEAEQDSEDFEAEIEVSEEDSETFVSDEINPGGTDGNE
jgi:hypothetical protein